jgi:hypothetical protein
MRQYAKPAFTIRPRRYCRSYYYGMSRADSGDSAESRLPWQTSHRRPMRELRKAHLPFTRALICALRNLNFQA